MDIRPPIDVTEEILQACRAKGEFWPLFLDLYKEAGGLITLASAGNAAKLERNQAICAGLLVRIAKLMASVVRLSSVTEGEETVHLEHGETVQVLNRCIVESVVNVRYLLLKNSDAIYDKFVKNGLRGEREFYDMIHANMESRGGEQFAIEVDLLKSILDTCESSGVEIDEIDPKAGSWGGSFQHKLEALKFDQSDYTVLQRIPSHAVHGDWVHLLGNHLLRKGDAFEVNFDHLQTDGELLMPVAYLGAEAAKKYLDRYCHHYSVEPLMERIKSVQDRLMKVAESTGDWRVVS